MQTYGHHIEGSCGDADTIIVSSALEFARNDQIVTFVAKHTAVLIMLVYHWINGMEDIFIRKENRLSIPVEIFTVKEVMERRISWKC